MIDPIVVFGCMNSGTSLITMLLHLGGAWLGETKPGSRRNPLGFYENLGVNQIISYGRSRGYTKEQFRDAIVADLSRQGYLGGPWALKLFRKQVPAVARFDPFWVFPERDIENIFKSRIRYTNKKDHETTRNRVFDEYKFVSEIRKKIMENTTEYEFIHPDKLIVGDTSEIFEIYKRCGLIYYPDLVNHCIVKTFWEFRQENIR